MTGSPAGYTPAPSADFILPFDLIPDFIPVVGYLDDLIVVPLGVLLAVRLIPPGVMGDLRSQATARSRPASRAGLAIVIARRLEQTLAQAGRPVEAPEGKTIRARGALDDRIGPRIEVSEPAMIEIVRRADGSGAEKLRQ